MRIIFYLLIIIPSIMLGQSVSPAVLSSTGSSFETNNLNLDWTLGELSTETISSNQVQLTQGFHQGKLKIISYTTEVLSDLTISIFPNPTQHQLYVELESSLSSKIMLFDLKGNLLLQKDFSESSMELDLSSFPQSLYKLAIFVDNVMIKWYNIEKIH